MPSDEETQYLKQAIELLTSYEYGSNPEPPVKPPKGTGGIKPAPFFPKPDKRGVSDKESLRIAIELLSKYEYGPKQPDIPGPYLPTLEPELQYMKKDKRSPLKKEEEYQIQQAIEILSSYEYGQPGPGPKKPFPVKSGPYFPQGPELQYVPKTKRSPPKKEEEFELQQAIELLSYYEYGQPGPGPVKPYPVKPKYPFKPDIYLPTTDSQIQNVPKTKRSPLKKEEQYEIQQAIELLSQYEYGQTNPPILPVKPVPVKPSPYNPPIKGGPKYAIPRSIDDLDATESIRAAIELLSKYEYGPYVQEPAPYPYRLGPNEHIPRSVPHADKESLIAAIELLNNYEYKDNPYPPIKPAPTLKPYPVYTLGPVPTLKPAPVPKYDPAPIKGPVIGKRKIEETLESYPEGGSETDIQLAIELLSKYEYGNNPPTKPIPAPTYKPVPVPTVKPMPFPFKPGTGPFIPQPKIQPQYPKRAEPSADVEKEKAFRAAIELLSKFEYDQPGPVKPFPGKPLPGKPLPYTVPIFKSDLEKETIDSNTY